VNPYKMSDLKLGAYCLAWGVIALLPLVFF
jgi:hypothetical protein